MSLLNQKLSNLLQYFGFQSKNYHLGDILSNYDSNDRIRYYLDFSKRAEFDGEIDSNGIPIYEHKSKKFRHPAIATLYALGNCEQYSQTGDSKFNQRVLNVADWLVKSQDDSGGWKSPILMPKFDLNRPFYSSLIQGMAISVLVRAALVTDNQKYIQAAIRATNLFDIEVKDGGVCRKIAGLTFYEEYPSEKKYHVLNGFIYSLWGLLDLIRYNDNVRAGSLWESGLKTLGNILPRYDTGSWSLYHIGDGMKNPATITYHKIHVEQLKVMHEITGNRIFQNYADKWESYLDKRFNALRTLPKKILWNIVRGL